MVRGDNVITDNKMKQSFAEGVAEGMMQMYGADGEPLYHVLVHQAGTCLVDKPVNAAGALEIVQTYLVEIGGNDIAISIDPISEQERSQLLSEPNDDEVVDAELVEEQ